MRKLIWVGLSLLLAGCASSLKEIDSPDKSTYVYGYAEISGATRFQVNLKNMANGTRYSYTKGWMGLPFSTKKLLFAFQVDPGKWELESIVASKGGQMAVPTGPKYAFEVSEGKGNFMGLIRGTINPFDAITRVDDSQRADSKTEVDAKMGEEFPKFDTTATVLIRFAKE
jgi:hypothetical protein